MLLTPKLLQVAQMGPGPVVNPRQTVTRQMAFGSEGRMPQSPGEPFVDQLKEIFSTVLGRWCHVRIFVCTLYV